MNGFFWIWIIIWGLGVVLGIKKKPKNSGNEEEPPVKARIKNTSNNPKQKKAKASTFGKALFDDAFEVPKKKKRKNIPEGMSTEGPTPLKEAMDPARIATLNKIKEEAKNEAAKEALDYCETHHGIESIDESNIALGMAWSVILDKPRALKPYGGKN